MLVYEAWIAEHGHPLGGAGARPSGGARFLEYLNYRSTASLHYYQSWKPKLETEGEAEAEGSFYALLQKDLQISCKKTRICDKKWHL